MNGFLLDANVLIALAWPEHSAHAVVQRWFGRNARHGWATSPMTQCAFVRIISNPAFSPHALSPGEALDLLSANLQHPFHRFLPDDISLLNAVTPVESKITGHRQITDVYLLSLANHHKRTFATLDQGIAAIAGTLRVELLQ